MSHAINDRDNKILRVYCQVSSLGFGAIPKEKKYKKRNHSYYTYRRHNRRHQQKHALLIINTLAHKEKLRFNYLTKQLCTISPKTLSDPLKQLQTEKLITRQAYPEIPPRVEYTLTKDGTGLAKAILPLIKWAAQRDNKTKKCHNTCHTTSAHKTQKTDPEP
ncbi:MAG: helix-turn-helix transcriptional regulator [Candidatus Bathyarchaeota archaeon]|nr:helix-turn-helix transcriptional regulator [Candidatus Bathyarchaeota archaeon]